MNIDSTSAPHLALDQAQGVAVSRRMPSSGDILVVDDEVAITELIAEALREEGYTVQVAHDGASALLGILACPPTLIILDIAMPVMTGDKLLSYLRGNHFSDLPVIVLSAGMHPERMLAQGATAVLAKPFELDALLDQVTRHAPLPTSLARDDALMARTTVC